MGEYESAVGLLKSMPNLKKTTKITFYQKLNRHREALKEYDALDDKVKA